MCRTSYANIFRENIFQQDFWREFLQAFFFCFYNNSLLRLCVLITFRLNLHSVTAWMLTPCLKQAQYLRIKWLQRHSNSHLGRKRTPDHLSKLANRSCVVSTLYGGLTVCFYHVTSASRLNLHWFYTAIVWISRKSLLEILETC